MSAQVCRLCREECSLRNSHILPEFLYKHCYDEMGRAIVVSPDKRSKILAQKGIREPLLCDGCEQHLSRIEGGFKRLWYNGELLPDEILGGHIELRDFNYNQFKLFHLSILWRSSVSKLDECASVNLGRHEDNIAELILAGDSGEESKYRIFGQVITHADTKVAHDWISFPQRYRFQGHTAYFTCYAGCKWTFLISSHSTDKFKRFCLRDNGSIILIHTTLTEHWDWIRIDRKLQTKTGTDLIEKYKRLRSKHDSQ